MTEVAALSLDMFEGVTQRPKRSAVIGWGLWDWASASFHAVITTFVFGPYVAEAVAPKNGALSGAQWISISSAVGGLVIALTAPMVGQRADAKGRRKRSLGIWSVATLAVMYGLFTIKADPAYLFLALTLLTLGNVFMEFGGVSYHAMLKQVSTPRTVGRVSGVGWSLGYFGGIFLLLISYVAFIKPEHPFFGTSGDPGLPYRMVAVFCATWFLLFGVWIFLTVPEIPKPADAGRPLTIKASYLRLWNDLKRLYKLERNAVWFLGAAALYRDGLSAIFTFGAVLAVSVYGMAKSEVLIFGVAANVVAALGAVSAGIVEDRVGPKPIILTSLISLVVTAGILLFVHGVGMFWIFGLILCLWVGPAQSSSRTFLTRLAPPGHEGEMFGLYSTTGRAVSFLAPALFGLFAGIGGDRTGIIGIQLVLIAGLVAVLYVRSPRRDGRSIHLDAEQAGATPVSDAASVAE